MKKASSIILAIILLMSACISHTMAYSKENVNSYSSPSIIYENEYKTLETDLSEPLEVFAQTPDATAGLNISESELEALLHDYQSQITAVHGDDPISLEGTLDGFAQYAVDTGTIPDTPEARASITKAAVRLSLKVAAEIGSIPWPVAATLLNHSLQDDPSDLTYASGTVADSVRDCSEYDDILAVAKEKVNDYIGSSVAKVSYSGSTTLDSTSDLKIAFNKVSYDVELIKTSDRAWTIKITIHDTYNFDPETWKDLSSDPDIVDLMNNYGIYAEQVGAVVPYDIDVILASVA